jgi:hypothetical protein
LRLLLAFALLTPILLVAIDHHGAERIATHAHLSPVGENVPPHVHGYEVPHTHGAPSANPEVAPLIVPAVPTVVVALALAQVSSLPISRPVTLKVVEPWDRILVPADLTGDQAAFDPPTPPPVQDVLSDVPGSRATA